MGGGHEKAYIYIFFFLSFNYAFGLSFPTQYLVTNNTNETVLGFGNTSENSSVQLYNIFPAGVSNGNLGRINNTFWYLQSKTYTNVIQITDVNSQTLCNVTHQFDAVMGLYNTAVNNWSVTSDSNNCQVNSNHNSQGQVIISVNASAAQAAHRK